jgi:hypothetical protein
MAMDSKLRLFSPGDPHAKTVLFAGVPGLVEADLCLENGESTDLVLREASLISRSIPVATTGHHDEVIRITVPKILPAHQRKLLSVSLDLDPSTPPGTYDAEIRIEGAMETKRFAVQITVVQNYALSIEPEQFVFTSDSGSTVSGELVVRNEGNVPIRVTPIGEYPLRNLSWFECISREHDWRTIGRDRERYAESTETHDPQQQDEDFESLLIDNKDISVDPGSWAVVKFTAKLPDSLPANEHLRARPRIGTERFNVDIITPFVPSAGVTKSTHKRRYKKGG